MTRSWENFWATKDTPLNRSHSSEFYDKISAELRLILDNYPTPTKVLDLGCGDGAMYRPMGFNNTKYTGVDFSVPMLEQFKSREPAVHLLEGDAAAYQSNEIPDLIFSCGVLQYFSPRLIRKHLKICCDSMADEGVILHASIPWSKHKWLFRSGWGAGVQPHPHQRFKQLLRPAVGWWNDHVGYWHSPITLSRIAESLGLKCYLYGSINYIYRFNAVFTKQ